MGTEVISAITLCNRNWHAHGVFCTHALHPLVEGKRMSFSSLPVRPAYAILMTSDLIPSRSRRRDRLAAICANLETIHNTPQVDISPYRNRTFVTRAIRKGQERTLAFLALLRALTTFLPTFAQPVFGNDQSNDTDKSKSEKKKPDKNKSKPEKQGNKEQQEQQKPKTKG